MKNQPRPSILEKKYISIEGRKAICQLPYLAYFLNRNLFYRSSTLKDATHLLITDQYGRKSIASVKLIKCVSEKLKRFIENGHIKLVEIQYSRYIYDIVLGKYVQPALDVNLLAMSLSEAFLRSKSSTLAEFRVLHGKNELKFKKRSLIRIIFDNFTDSVFLINIVSISTYYFMEYLMYFFILLTITLYQFGKDVHSELISEQGLVELAKKGKVVKVCCNGRWVGVSSSNIYPGNIILIETLADFPCDCRILKGEVIADESFLTGESIPVNKSADGNNIVFAGTTILKSRSEKVDINELADDIPESDKIVKVKNLVKTRSKHQGEAAARSVPLKNATGLAGPAKTEEQNEHQKDFSIVKSASMPRKERSPDAKVFVDSSTAKKNGPGSYGRASKNAHVEKDLGDKRKLREAVDEEKNRIDVDEVEGKVNESSIGVHMAESTRLAIGLVLSTGFETTKGKLLKSILTPRPPDFRFYREARVVIKAMFVVGLILCFALLLYFLKLPISPRNQRLYAIDMFFTFVSPQLMTAVLFGTCIAKARLRKLSILCYDKERINSAGQVDIVVFDKTGTLTEEGLDIYALDNLERTYDSVETCSSLVKLGISVCHGVIMLDNEIVGDPLDLKMFKFSMARIDSEKDVYLHEESLGYSCEGEERMQNNGNGKSAKILKTFEFDNKLRRMSSVVEHNSKRLIFTKGSPESIKPLLCTVPKDYDEDVREYALDGYRVIVLAYKELENADALARDTLEKTGGKSKISSRDELEKDLVFLALIVFANKPKPASFPAILELNKSGMKILMATGDNILTAVSVAREVGIVDEVCPVIFPVLNEDATNIFDIEWMCIGDEELVFDKITLTLYKGRDRISYTDFVVAVEGKEYEFFRAEKTYFDFILNKTVIFARMNPEQKKMLIEDLAEKGYTTAFCGDGANDCGALKSAEVGIALAQNEASVASSFTSKVKDISAVLSVLKEGRAALVGSASRFRFIFLTIMIQFGSLLVLALLQQFLNDWQTTHIDVLSILTLTFSMSKFRASSSLSHFEVTSSLLSKKCVLLLLGNTLIQLSFHVLPAAFFEHPPGDGNDFNLKSELGTAVFFITCFQIYTLAFILTEGMPHREPKLKKTSFLCAWCILVFYTCFLMFNTYFQWVSESFFLKYYDFASFKTHSKFFLLLVIILANLVSTLLFWYFLNFWKVRRSKNEQNDDTWDEVEV